jgi:hypothetical protein
MGGMSIKSFSIVFVNIFCGILCLEGVVARAQTNQLDFVNRYNSNVLPRWGGESKLQLGGTNDCPSTNARYGVVADIVLVRELDGDRLIQESRSPSNIFLILPKSRRSPTWQARAPKANDEVHIALGGMSIEVSFFTDRTLTEHFVLKAEDGEFKCAQGVASLAPTDFAGSGESGRFSGVATIQIATTEDGSVVYRQILSQKWSAFFAKDSYLQVERYFRFSRSTLVEGAGTK